MCEYLLERFGNHAVFVGLRYQIARLIGIERLNRSKVRWILEHDVIAGIEEDLRDQIQALLRAVHDQHVGGSYSASEFFVIRSATQRASPGFLR